MSNRAAISYSSKFKKALETLNPAQLQAIEKIDGAVLVVAGPGTGKTQLLAARIGYILQNTDTHSSEILCLTFTDAGAIAMRERLLQFIGPEAYNVSIHTFHSFCNQVISENIDLFGGYYDLQALSELERIQLMNELIDDFPDDHPLKRFKGNVYYDRQRLVRLFDILKKEGWTPEYVKLKSEEYLEALKEDPEMLYKRKSGSFQKGDLKIKDYNKKKKKIDEFVTASFELKNYDEKLRERERFDFNDMILWVINKFKENGDLLSEYQERYQYFLVDEYQDTNGAQNEVLELLTSFWEDPNLFVVGDDDQSIYRFQGANMGNIIQFSERYSPSIIVLENNYRSSQKILDCATQLIEFNDERLVKYYQGKFEKKLIESRIGSNNDLSDPQIVKFSNETQEEVFIVKELERLYKEGQDLSEVAIIYRKHKNVEDIVSYLEKRSIPLNIKRKLDILNTPEIDRIVNILKYIKNESARLDSASDLLFEILHYEYFELSPRDIGLISFYAGQSLPSNTEDSNWVDLLENKDKLKEIGVKDADGMFYWFNQFQKWIIDSKNNTLQILLEKIFSEGRIIETIMKSSEKVFRLQLLNSFFDWVKEESTKKPDLMIAELLEFIDLMKQSNVAMEYERIISNEKGVNFITAHSAKGLEFKYVYILKCTSENWEQKRNFGNSFTFPSNLTSSSDQGDIEDERRLFYVAMTRAKDSLIMTYAAQSDNEKAFEPSRFLTEVQNPEEYIERSVPDEYVLDYKAELMLYNKKDIELIDHNLIDLVLQDFRMSVTSLNKYLNCPLKFYFETVLRVPQARNANMGFGRAIHFAMEQFLNKLKLDKEQGIPGKGKLIEAFQTGMEKSAAHFTPKEFKELSTYGSMILEKYFESSLAQWHRLEEFKTEHKIELTEFRGVPIKGVLDRIDYYKDSVEVTDYKTGKYWSPQNRKKLKPPIGEEDPGGDYWRQIVFYKILVDQDPRINKRMSKAYLDFIEPNKEGELKIYPFEVEDFEIELVADQLVASYEKIKNHAFSEGCGEEDCKWCNFVTNHFKFQSTFEEFEDEDR